MQLLLHGSVLQGSDAAMQAVAAGGAVASAAYLFKRATSR